MGRAASELRSQGAGWGSAGMEKAVLEISDLAPFRALKDNISTLHWARKANENH